MKSGMDIEYEKEQFHYDAIRDITGQIIQDR